MALQLSTAIRHAQLDVIETEIGTSATLEIRTGAPPASCAAADSGTLLAEVALPADFFENAGATTEGVKGLLGTWEDASADATGTAGHFRIKDSGGDCHMQGTVGQGSGDMSVTNVSFAAGQAFAVNSFNIGAANG